MPNFQYSVKVELELNRDELRQLYELSTMCGEGTLANMLLKLTNEFPAKESIIKTVWDEHTLSLMTDLIKRHPKTVSTELYTEIIEAAEARKVQEENLNDPESVLKKIEPSKLRVPVSNQDYRNMVLSIFLKNPDMNAKDLSAMLKLSVEEIVKRCQYQEMESKEILSVAEYVQLAGCTEMQDYSMVAERLKEPQVGRLLHSIIGLITETGELADILKRFLFYGKPIDWVHAAEEIGDNQWYQAVGSEAIREILGFGLAEIMNRNIAKLKERYPNKFTEHDALNRNLESERNKLEGK
jgi:NTP pyrophosphatase (non-canonical NTP hydrolase)